jgi:predicted O-methyltransferase YrrM
MVQYYQPATIVEIGTSFGVTTAYLSNGNKNAAVYTCEGAASIASIAGETFDAMQIENIKIVRGDFNCLTSFAAFNNFTG